jgi:CheY-like chemotaxis protein
MTVEPSDAEQRATVIVADDEVHIVDVVALLLEPFDVTVVKAYNGEQVLHAMREHAPRLVITDIMMPKLNGIEVCRRIKADPSTAMIPVILLTSIPDDAVERSGADAFIPKPFNIEQIEAYARRYLGSASCQVTGGGPDGGASATNQ